MKLGVQEYFRKDELFQTDLSKIINPLLLEYRMKQESALSSLLKNNPNQLSVSVFKFSEIGPEPVITTLLPFEFPDEIKKETFLLKIGTQFMSATGSGHEYSQGLYELPVPGFEKYHSLVYAFHKEVESALDEQTEDQMALKYGIIVIIFPLLYRSMLPNRSMIDKRLRSLLDEYSDIEEIDNNFLFRTQKIFGTDK